MSNLSKNERIELFKNLFRGREDVFPRRWENKEKETAGYSPVYTDYYKSEYKGLSLNDIENHLLGKYTIGVYPLLEDNTSYFVVADFDKGTFKKDTEAFVQVCKKHKLPVYVEVSRSGKGAHIWCFFENKYDAYRSRKIFFALLRKSKCIDEYSHNESFDRLFPNQDQHSGKGLGNLIALPLQAVPRDGGKSVFVDIKNWKPVKDQWDFLTSINKLSQKELDKLYEKLTSKKIQKVYSSSKKSSVVKIEISNWIKIAKNQISQRVSKLLRDELNFFNSEFFVKQKTGLPTYNIEKFFKTTEVDNEYVYIPRGYIHNLKNIFTKNNTPFEIVDNRLLLDEVVFNNNLKLYNYQQEAVNAFDKKESGILISPTGSGKTIIALAIICSKKQPTLIITHRRHILDQWVNSIENFLNIKKKDIGIYSSGKKNIKSPITVATIQSLSKAKDLEKIADKFGCVIIDECHHIPAKTYRDIVGKFRAKYMFGLTATPKRKYNDERLIKVYLGEVIYEIESSQIENNIGDMNISVLKSDFFIPYKINQKDMSHLYKLLASDISRNTLIVENIKKEVSEKRNVLVLAERKEHVDFLYHFLKEDTEVIVLTGDLSKRSRNYRMKRVSNGTFQVLLSTGQLFGEGLDSKHFDTLFIVSPISFSGKLTQYIGRIMRGGGKKRIYDIHDLKVIQLDNMFKKRKTLYNKMIKSGEAKFV